VIPNSKPSEWWAGEHRRRPTYLMTRERQLELVRVNQKTND
jgi:hypothetical protein